MKQSGPQVRLSLRCPAEKEANSVRSEVAPGRSLHQDEWNPALLVAGRGRERSGHRYPGAAAPGPLGSFAFLSQVTPYGRESTARHHHGQATELCCSDEARFYLPALWWAEHLSLSPTNLHAPNGIFWVPDGFTIFLGSPLHLFGETMPVARATCECVVSLGVILFALGLRKLAGSSIGGVLATLLLLTPPVVFAANMVRMEAPRFLLISLVLLLHVHEHLLAAGSLLAASMLIHPALGIAAVGYNVIVCVTPRKGAANRSATTVMEWIIFAVLVISIAKESFRIVRHLTFRTFQCDTRRLAK
jgi:hypothetical protein